MRRHREIEQPPPVARRTSLFARFGALVLACAALTMVAFGGQALHMALVAHAVCPSHGEMVHESHDDDPQVHAESSEASVTEDGGAHGHCHVPGILAALSAPPPPAAPTETLTMALVRAPHLVDVVPSRRRRLLMAPKTPPPA